MIIILQKDLYVLENISKHLYVIFSMFPCELIKQGPAYNLTFCTKQYILHHGISHKSIINGLCKKKSIYRK